MDKFLEIRRINTKLFRKRWSQYYHEAVFQQVFLYLSGVVPKAL